MKRVITLDPRFKSTSGLQVIVNVEGRVVDDETTVVTITKQGCQIQMRPELKAHVFHECEEYQQPNATICCTLLFGYELVVYTETMQTPLGWHVTAFLATQGFLLP